MTPELIRQLITAQVELREDYTARLVPILPTDWYDPLELERLRLLLKVTRRGADLEILQPEELLRKLQLTEPSGKRDVPTIA
jgi:hypothetical protein